MKKLIGLLLMPIFLNAQGLDFLKKWKKNHDAKIEKRQAMRAAIWANETVYQTRLVGVAFQTQQNTNFSKVQYSGPSLNLTSQKITERKKFDNVYQVQMGVGMLNVDNYDGSIYSFANQLDFGHLYKIGKNLSIGPNVGYTINVRMNGEFENNALGLETGPDLGAKARISKGFNVFGVDFKGQYMLTVPIAAAMISLPSRTNSIDEKGLLGGLKTIKGYQRIGSNIQLAFQSSRRFPNRFMAINYNWGVQRINLNEDKFAATASHSISFIGNLTKLK